MKHRIVRKILFLSLCVGYFSINMTELVAQDPPGLFFREDWKEISAEIPITQEHVAHPDLVLKTYGPGGDSLKKSHHDHIPNDPWYLWSGNAEGPWAATLKHDTRNVNLTGNASTTWRTRQSGFHELRIILKLAGGDWLISDQSDGAASDWRVREFILKDIRWRAFDIEDIREGGWVSEPDLSNVEEIGFTDLRRGHSSPSSFRLDWIEVYGKPVDRP